MAVERRLTEIVGPVGGKLHTARSRNDQVATDMAMFTRAHALRRPSSRCSDLQSGAASQLAERHLDWAMPGYTHLQRAQPVYLVAPPARVLLDVPARRAALRVRARARPTELPLGAGALAGVNFDTDRGCVAPRARLRRRGAELDRRRLQPRLRARLPRAPRRPARRTSRASAPRSCCGRARSSASARCPTPGRRAPRSCRRRRTPTRPSCCARRRRASSRTWSALHGVHARPPADLQQGHAGGQGAPVRRRRHARALPARRRAGCSRGSRSTASGSPRAAADELIAATDVADLLVRRGVPFRQSHGIVAGLVREAVDSGRSLSELSREELARALATALDDEFYARALAAAPGSSRRSPRAAPRWPRVREQLAHARAELDGSAGVKPRLLRPAGRSRSRRDLVGCVAAPRRDARA